MAPEDAESWLGLRLAPAVADVDEDDEDDFACCLS